MHAAFAPSLSKAPLSSVPNVSVLCVCAHVLWQPEKEEKAAAAPAPAAKKEEETNLGPKVREGEEVFAVAHIFASFNDTFVVSLV